MKPYIPVLIITLFLLNSLIPISIASSPVVLVQSKISARGCAAPCALAFTSNTVSGNIIVVSGSTETTTDAPVPTDTQGNTYSKVNVCIVTNGGAGGGEACMYYTTAQSGADTVTWNPASSSGLFIYEVSGASSSTIRKSTGSGQCANGANCALTTSATVTENGGFTEAATNCGGANQSPTAGTGFTLDFGTGAGNNDEAAEHSTTGTASDPTNFPMTCHNGGTTLNWADLGAVFPANPSFSETGSPSISLSISSVLAAITSTLSPTISLIVTVLQTIITATSSLSIFLLVSISQNINVGLNSLMEIINPAAAIEQGFNINFDLSMTEIISIISLKTELGIIFNLVEYVIPSVNQNLESILAPILSLVLSLA